MATYTATAAQTNSSGFFLKSPKYNEKGVQAVTVAYNFTAAQSAGDVIFLAPIAKSAVLLDAYVTLTGFGGAAITLTGLGDSGSNNRYIGSLSTNGATAVLQRATQGVCYSYSAEDILRVTIGTATSASAVGTVRVTALFAFDQAADANAGTN
jgi:hypothetical protein